MYVEVGYIRDGLRKYQDTHATSAGHTDDIL